MGGRLRRPPKRKIRRCSKHASDIVFIRWYLFAIIWGNCPDHPGLILVDQEVNFAADAPENANYSVLGIHGEGVDEYLFMVVHQNISPWSPKFLRAVSIARKACFLAAFHSQEPGGKMVHP